MNQDQREAQRAVDELFDQFGPIRLDPKDIQRVKDAEKAARKRATNKGGRKGA